MTVWHNDTFGRNDFLGEVTVPLDYYEFKDASPKWYKLQERVSVANSCFVFLLIYIFCSITSVSIARNY